MEAPPPAAPPLTGASVHLNYADSVDSSPRSRNNDSFDDSLTPAVSGGGAKLRLMCSYGGHIVPRPHDKSLCYVGGDTRIVVAERQTTLSDLTNRLSKTLLSGQSFTLKYQLPNEDLDSLISVTTDEDLENMIEEFDRLTTTAGGAVQKSSRLRLFLFPTKPESAASIGSLLENSTKSEDWFLDALNGANRGLSDSVSVNCLLGLDDDVAITGNVNSKDVEAQIETFGIAKGVSGNSNNNKQGFQDVHSVPDSPMLETTSSFGSTSSSPSLANLPPIRVHVEDPRVAMICGIEEQFSQMSVGAAVQKQDDGGFMVLSSPPNALTTVAVATTVSGVPAGVSGEYSNRLISDDERSEQRMSAAYRKPPQPQPQAKQSGGPDLTSPDSVSSDGSIPNPLSRQRPMIYQDHMVQISSGNNRVAVKPVDSSDPNSNSGFVLQTQFDQQQQQQQFNQQQQLNQQQQQSFIQANTQYIQHHSTGVPSYYPIYPSQQQNPQMHPHHGLDQQYPVYYMPARPTQAYNLSVQQSNYSEPAASAPSNRPQTPPPPTMIPNSGTYNPARNAVGAAKPEMVAGLYRTAASSGQQFMQLPSSQHQHQHQPQYIGFSQMHHPSQSMAPTSAGGGNYAYEFADPTHAQVYYSRAMAPQMAAQHQTMTSDAQLPTDNIKQQIRTSQP